MTFHDQAAFTESLNETYPPIDGNEFSYYLGRLDKAIAITKKLETVAAKPAKRGIVRWWFR